MFLTTSKIAVGFPFAPVSDSIPGMSPSQPRRPRTSKAVPLAPVVELPPSVPVERKPIFPARFLIFGGIAVILLLAIFTRFAQLGYQGYHHDESIHALHSWKIANDPNFRYRYDPVYHGPFLYHFGALFHKLGLPDTNAYARFPYALLGFLLIGLWMVLGRRLGWGAVFLVSGLITLSPIVNYFSRFARNDVYMSAWLTGMLVFGSLYCWTRKVRYLTLAVIPIALSYCTKENSYINNFGVCAFLVGWGAVIALREGRTGLRRILVDYLPLTRFLALIGCFAVFVFAYVAIDSRVGPETGLIQGLVRIAQHSTSVAEKADASAFRNESGFFTNASRAATKQSYFQFAIAFSTLLLILLEITSAWLRTAGQTGSRLLKNAALAVVTSALFMVLAVRLSSLPEWLGNLKPDDFFSSLFRRTLLDVWVMSILTAAGPLAVAFAAPAEGNRWRSTWTDWKEYLFGMWGFILTIAICVSLYLTLFTSLGNNIQHGSEGGLYQYIAYWFKHQTGDYRIWGPWWYYVPRMFLFETLSLFLLVSTGTAFAAAGIKDLLRRRKQAPGSAELAPPLEGEPGPGNSSAFWKPLPLPLLVCAGFLTAFFSLVYALLNEKVPWLGTYQAYMTAVTAGLWTAHWLAIHPASPGPISGRIRDLFNAFSGLQGTSPTWVAIRGFYLVAVVALFLFVVGQHAVQVFIRPDQPSELLVYTGTTHDFAEQMRRVERMQEKAGGALRIAVQGKSEWPSVWYFRKWKPAFKSLDLSADIVIVDDTPENRRRLSLARDHVWDVVPCHLRGWWIWHGVPDALPGKLEFLPNLKAFLANVSNDQYARFPVDQRPDIEKYPSGFRSQVWNYVFRRRLWYPTAGESVLVAYKTDRPVLEENLEGYLEGSDAAPVFIRPVRVQMNASGTPESRRQPRGIDVGPDGRIAVADSLNGRVQILNSSAEFVSNVGAGVLSGKYSGVSDVAWDDKGNLFVADTWNHAVAKFDPAGKVIRVVKEWGKQGIGFGTFFGPRGIATDRNGNVYVTDTGHKLVRGFDSDLNPINAWGGEGAAAGQFNEPVGIDVDPEGRVVVADTGNGRVQRFHPSGVFIDEFITLPATDSDRVSLEPNLDVLKDGRIVVSYSSTENVWVIDPVGKKVSIIKVGAAHAGLPTGVAARPDGGFWVGSRNSGMLSFIQVPQ